MNSRAHIFVSGRVQGVFFRDHTRSWAKSLNLTGWVMNLSDGRVEVMVEGERENIEELIEKLKEGPPLAKVENVEVNWEGFRGEFNDFQIKWSKLW